jgi:hypothetical protein
MTFIYLFLPETSHSHSGGISELTTPFNFVWINPFSSIWLLRSPNIMAVVCLHFSSDCTLHKALFSDTSKYVCDDYRIWYVEKVDVVSQSNQSSSSIDPHCLHDRELSSYFKLSGPLTCHSRVLDTTYLTRHSSVHASSPVDSETSVCVHVLLFELSSYYLTCFTHKLLRQLPGGYPTLWLKNGRLAGKALGSLKIGYVQSWSADCWSLYLFVFRD